MSGRRRRPWGRLALAAALATAAAGALVVAGALEPGGARVAGAVAPVNGGAADPADIAANNSPSLARNPRRAANVVVVNRVDTPSFSCAAHVSFDAGARWRPTRLPFPAGEEDPPRCFAPDAAFGPDGRLFVSFVTLAGAGNVPHAGWVTTSTDGGRTFAVPTRATGPLAFQLRLATDPVRAGRVHLVWLQATATGTLAFPDGGNPIVSARSDDGGRSWSEPVRVSSAARERVVAPAVASGSDGNLFALYLDVRDDRLDYHGAHEGRGGEPFAGRWSLVLARSSDSGATWSETVVDDQLSPTGRFVAFFPPSPSLAVDRERGRVYAAFHDGRGGDADVLAWASGDDGRSFGPAVRVNDTPAGDGTAQYLPRAAVAPDGRLDVVYYDRRADLAGRRNEVSLQSSGDGGRSFGPRLRISDRSFDAGIGFGSERGMPDLGSRLALDSSDEAALAVWTDTRAGTEASNKQDLARARVRFDRRSAARAPLIALGLLGLLAACVVAARAGRSRADADRSDEAGPVPLPVPPSPASV